MKKLKRGKRVGWGNKRGETKVSWKMTCTSVQTSCTVEVEAGKGGAAGLAQREGR